MREFSPIELRTGRDEVDTCADRGQRSSRMVFEEARAYTGLHVIEATRSNSPDVTSIGDKNWVSLVKTQSGDPGDDTSLLRTWPIGEMLE